MKFSLTIACIILALLIPAGMLLAAPGIPHQFYGTVDFTNGAAPDGLLVEVKVNGIKVGSATTAGGKYGYPPSLLFATKADGEWSGEAAEFYVGGIKATTAEAITLAKGEYANLNLTVPCKIGTIVKNEGEKVENEEVVVTPQSSINIQLGSNLSVTISSATNTSATVEKIEKLSSGNVAVFSGKNFLNAYEIKISGGNLNISVTMKYDDSGIDEDTIAPYRFDGASWVAITSPAPTINKTANTITFVISSGQTVYGIFGSAITQNPPPSGGDSGGDGTPPSTPASPLSAAAQKVDANKDNKVDKYDFALLMANWGKTGTNVCDFNSDGKVDKYDFALLMLNWSI